MDEETRHVLSERLFSAGPEDLSDLELAAAFFSFGCADGFSLKRARRLLHCLQGRLDSASLYRQLRDQQLQADQALATIAGLHLLRRLDRVGLKKGMQFSCSLDIYRHFHPRMVDLKKECFWTALLDGKNRYLRLVRISEGSLTASLVHPREVFRPAILAAAAALLCVHNHPSGDPAPSSEDLHMTRRLVETGRLIGIRVLDHVIVGERRYFSFADEGML